MKRQMTSMCVALAWSVAAVAAQDSMSKGGMDKMDKMAKGTVKVTGCVAAGSMADHYMLTHAEMSHDAMGKDKMAMEHDKMAGDAMMSYVLAGGNLKAHVGHKVEVTGTLDKKNGMGNMKAKDSTAKDDMTSSTLKVQSVKMLSDSCS